MLSGTTESPPSERTDGRKSEGEMYRQFSKQLLGKEGDSLGNELSAPYEVPQFPIEQIEQKLHRVRSDGPKLGKQISVETALPSPTVGGWLEGGGEEQEEEEEDVDLSELIPDFQRVKISGEDNTGVPVEDLLTASHLLVRALAIREKYMRASHQEFSSNVERSVQSESPHDVTFLHLQVSGRYEQRANDRGRHHRQSYHRRYEQVSSETTGVANTFLMKEIENIYEDCSRNAESH